MVSFKILDGKYENKNYDINVIVGSLLHANGCTD